MGKKCIATGCSKKHSDGVSLFLFPTDENLRHQWTKQVQRTRACWQGPTVNSCLCSDHFTEDSFDPSSLTAAKLGMKRKLLLKSDAIPTIFVRSIAGSIREEPKKKRRVSSAFEKRERKRVSVLYYDSIIIYIYIYICLNRTLMKF